MTRPCDNAPSKFTDDELEFLIHHMVMPPKLPTENDIQPNPLHEVALVKLCKLAISDMKERMEINDDANGETI